MDKTADFLELWNKACAGTPFAQAETADLLRQSAVQIFAKNHPDTSAAEMACRVRFFIPDWDAYAIRKGKLMARFLRSLPPGTPLKTIVKGLWV